MGDSCLHVGEQHWFLVEWFAVNSLQVVKGGQGLLLVSMYGHVLIG